jgi:hypothetical protein
LAGLFLPRHANRFLRGELGRVFQLLDYVAGMTETRSELKDFIKRAQWLSVAVTLSDRHMTLGECAMAMGLDPATVRRPLHKMCDEGLVETDDSTRGRGAHYWLHSDVLDDLDEAVRMGQPIGWLLETQRLWHVQAPQLLAMARVFDRGDLARSITWAAELGGGAEYLLAMDLKQSVTAVGRVRTALEQACAKCLPFQVSTLFSGEEFGRHLAALRDAAP